MHLAPLLAKYDYAEVLLTKNAYSRAVLRDKEVQTARTGGGETVSCRVLANGAFGFASSNRPSELPGLLREAEKLARARKGREKMAAPEVHGARTRAPCRKDPQAYSLEEKIAWLKEYGRQVRRKGVYRAEIGYTDSVFETHFHNSHGADLLQKENRIACSVHAYAKKGGRIEAAFDQVKRRAGVEALESMPKKIENAARQALMLLEAGKGPAGKMTAVLDPELAGVMAHEAVGHACEADEVTIGGSCLKGKLGRKLASNAVSISDAGSLEKGLWGSFDYDHEGTAAKYTKLVERGVLKNYLTSLDTAYSNRGKLSGNARGQPGDPPIVRMSNTFFEPGDSTKEELLQEAKNGVYLVGCKEGQVSPKTGNFTFAARYGYLLRNGQPTKLFKDGAINGNILESLKRVRHVAKDLDFAPGTCGKSEQNMPVTTGSPHLLIDGILVG